MRRTKIVCTMGPACASGDRLERLIAAGMDCARLNFSHGDHESHARMAERVRRAAAAAGRPVSLLCDLQGPKIRVGRFPEGSVELDAGQKFVLTGGEGACDREHATVSYEQLANDVRGGDVILLDDGLLQLRVERVDGDEVHTVVEVGGRLSDNKGVNLPGAKLSVPALTEKDRRDLEFAVNQLRVDYVALSFVRRAEDVREAQELAGDTPVIAKLEKPEALENLEAICDQADGVMVARGDLGVEVGSAKVPLVQKRIIREANQRGKLVITATQMLDSMIRNPRPTRAEAADVANAVLDGTDAVMLSGETATGRYPVESVQMMDSIALEVEEATLEVSDISRARPMVASDWELTSAAAKGAALLSFTLPLSAIVVFSSDGRSAELVSEYRPRAPIFAIVPNERAAQRLAVRWGVTPVFRQRVSELAELPERASEELIDANLARPGDAIAVVTGWEPGERTNTVTLHRVTAKS